MSDAAPQDDPNQPRSTSPEPVSEEVLATLGRSSTATISTELHRMGYRGMFLTGLAPLRPDLTMVGRAVTLRYVPARQDLSPDIEFDNRRNKQRVAVELVGPGDVLVIDCRGETRTGSLGQILAHRILMRGAAGIVTDGAFRDYTGIQGLPLPTYAGGRHADISPTLHHPIDINLPIACAGVTVLPGDIMVGDGDGVIVVPAAIASQVAEAAALHENREEFIQTKIRMGEPITDVYPLRGAVLAEWQEWQKAHGG